MQLPLRDIKKVAWLNNDVVIRRAVRMAVRPQDPAAAPDDGAVVVAADYLAAHQRAQPEDDVEAAHLA
jgi:hypothetical protein